MSLTPAEFPASLVSGAQQDGIAGFVAAVVTEADRVLLVRRRSEDFMDGMWEIPSGKVEEGESVLEALRRGDRPGRRQRARLRRVGHFDYPNSRGGTTRQFNFAVTVEKAEPVVLAGRGAPASVRRIPRPLSRRSARASRAGGTCRGGR
ncbi:NUDIX hydrolase [Kitasatospora sp. NPDC052896]|uniref:NUDIX hydrolase n=1 Tax=Kitasatospora sp. NPDC052896 TaxID=3364061 RepID=UPI0037CAA547